MSFWDASAVVPLCLREQWTAELRALSAAERSMTLWWGTRVEVESAIARRYRDGQLTPTMEDQARSRLERLVASCAEVSPSARVRELAIRVLRVHELRAGDALQLAAALVWSAEEVNSADFVCLDSRLREAAMREGFRAVPAACPQPVHC